MLFTTSAMAAITQYPADDSGSPDLSGTQPSVFNDPMFIKDGLGDKGLGSGRYQSERRYVVQSLKKENISDGGIPQGLVDFMDARVPIPTSVSA